MVEGSRVSRAKPDLLGLIGDALDRLGEYEDDERRQLSNSAISLLSEEASHAAVSRAAKRFREIHLSEAKP